MTYPHRNGETEAPTVPGLYWFRSSAHSWFPEQEFQRPIHVLNTSGEALAWNDGRQSYDEIDDFVGKWWGPIVAPWESEAK